MSTHRTAAFVGGLACIALGAVTLAGPPVPDHDWGAHGAVVNALGLLAFAMLAVSLGLLPGVLRAGRLGAVGTVVAQIGLALMCVESVASQVHGGNTLGPVFMLGLLATVVGLGLVCIAGLRRRRWFAPLPLLGVLFGIAGGEHGGFIVTGLVWITLASSGVESSGTPRVSVPTAMNR